MNNLSDISNKSRQFNAKYIIISIITLLIFFIISVVSETNTLFFFSDVFICNAYGLQHKKL